MAIKIPLLAFSFILNIDETNTPKDKPAKEPTMARMIIYNILES